MLDIKILKPEDIPSASATARKRPINSINEERGSIVVYIKIQLYFSVSALYAPNACSIVLNIFVTFKPYVLYKV